MNTIDFNKIKLKHNKLIDKSISIMSSIKDNEHNFEHVKDVLYYLNILLNNIEDNYDLDACVIAAYWHDTGRILSNDEHEKISAEMLRKEMIKLGYDKEFIQTCYDAIILHKWNMFPVTIEGKIIKDADKLAWLGLNRWKECYNNNQDLDSIVKLLPKLRNEILFFECSKNMYDKDIIELLEFLYDISFKNR